MRPFVHKRHIAKRRLGNRNQTDDGRGYDCNKRKRIISEHLLPVGGIKTGRFSFHINKVNIKERLAKTDGRQIVSLSECRGHTDEQSKHKARRSQICRLDYAERRKRRANPNVIVAKTRNDLTHDEMQCSHGNIPKARGQIVPRPHPHIITYAQAHSAVPDFYQNLLFSAQYSNPAPQSATSTSARSTP